MKIPHGSPQKKHPRGFTVIEMLLMLFFLGSLVAIVTATYQKSVTVDTDSLQNANLTPCVVAHSHGVLGQGLALTSALLEEIKASCTKNRGFIRAQPNWKSPLYPAKTPSADAALALNEHRFTALQWAQAVSPLQYDRADFTEAPVEQKFSFWEYDAWYWETNAKNAKDNPNLLVNIQHQRVLAEKDKAMSSGVRSSTAMVF